VKIDFLCYSSHVNPTGMKGASLEAEILFPSENACLWNCGICIFGLLSNVKAQNVAKNLRT
jgi:hypothetical protein